MGDISEQLADIKSRIGLMESRVTKDLKIQMKALVEENVKKLLDDAIVEYEHRLTSYMDESSNLSAQNTTEQTEIIKSEMEGIKIMQTTISLNQEDQKASLSSIANQIEEIKEKQASITMSQESQKTTLSSIGAQVGDISAKQALISDELESYKISLAAVKKQADDIMTEQVFRTDDIKANESALAILSQEIKDIIANQEVAAEENEAQIEALIKVETEVLETKLSETQEAQKASLAALIDEFNEFKSKQESDLAAHGSQKTMLDAIGSEMKTLSLHNTGLQAQISHLTQSLAQKEEKIDALEQYTRRDNILISGVPMKKEENTSKIVLHIAKLLTVEMSANDIFTSHRLPKSRDGSSSIIVKFSNRNVRDRILENKKIAERIEDFGIEGMTNLYISENLTKRRLELLYLARQRKKTYSYDYLWTKNGKIFARKKKGEKRICIEREEDLDIFA